jgi:tight adherence protein B
MTALPPIAVAMPTSAGGRARRRARGLTAPAVGPLVTARLASSIEELAIPGDAERTAAAVPAAALVLVAIAWWVGGAIGVLAWSASTCATVVALRRSAPARRERVSERDLPTVLESVARQLRAGGSLAQALEAASPAGPGVLHDRWTTLVELIPVVGVATALRTWAAGAPSASTGTRLAAAALALAAETGGSPARAVDGVAATLRARRAVADELRALSTQARASALVIAVAPVVFGAAAAATDDRTTAMLSSPTGVALLVGGLALDAVGAAWMARLCRPTA